MSIEIRSQVGEENSELYGIEEFLCCEHYGYFYSKSGKNFDYLHMEITAYFLSLLCQYGEIEKAFKTGDFLLSCQQKNGAFPHSIPHRTVSNSRFHECHIFDTGICARALLDLYDITEETKYLRSAESALDWIEYHWDPYSQAPRSMYDSSIDRWDPPERRMYWSTAGGCYLGKLLIPFAMSGRDQTIETWLEWLTSMQRDDGSFPASPNQGDCHTHAMCYALEGLFYLLENGYSGKVELEEHLRAGIQYLAHVADLNDGLPEWVNNHTPCYRTDSQIQYIRLVNRLKNTGIDLFGQKSAVKACNHRLSTLRHDVGWRISTNRRAIGSWNIVFYLNDKRLKETEGDII